MSVDGAKEAILAAVRQRCPLKNNNESSGAARAIRYYMGEEVAAPALVCRCGTPRYNS